MTRKTQSESEEIRRISDNYRRLGYRTIIHPRPAELPQFLNNIHPDLVAFSDHDNVIVEVKFRESSLGDPKLTMLAEAVDKHPNWRFELVQVGKRRGRIPRDVPPRRDVIDISQARERLVTARGLAAKQPPVSMLATWTVLEGAIRALLQSVDLVPVPQISATLKQAYSFGFLSWRTFEYLLRHLEYRNAVVHGMRTSVTHKEALALIQVAKKLLEQWDTHTKTLQSPNRPKRKLSTKRRSGNTVT